MTARSILVAGFPESGKTSFLAALWHIVNAGEMDTALKFESLSGCDAQHLNEITARWRNVSDQERTKTGAIRFASMNLRGATGNAIRVTFPDVSGEEYRDMWEQRSCDRKLASVIGDSTDVMLFIHADRIVQPRWVIDEAEIRARLGLSADEAVPQDWSPRLAPTQVQIVDLLQVITMPPLDSATRRLAVVMSAWDRVKEEGRSPTEFFAERLPLVKQFLDCQEGSLQRVVFGVSALGGQIKPNNDSDRPRAESVAQQLRAIDRPSDRVQVVADDWETHDLTRVVSWFLD